MGRRSTSVDLLAVSKHMIINIVWAEISDIFSAHDELNGAKHRVQWHTVIGSGKLPPEAKDCN